MPFTALYRGAVKLKGKGETLFHVFWLRPGAEISLMAAVPRYVSSRPRMKARTKQAEPASARRRTDPDDRATGRSLPAAGAIGTGKLSIKRPSYSNDAVVRIPGGMTPVDTTTGAGIIDTPKGLGIGASDSSAPNGPAAGGLSNLLGPQGVSLGMQGVSLGT